MTVLGLRSWPIVVELRFGRVWVIGFVFSSHLRTRVPVKALRPEILQHRCRHARLLQNGQVQ